MSTLISCFVRPEFLCSCTEDFLLSWEHRDSESQINIGFTIFVACYRGFYGADYGFSSHDISIVPVHRLPGYAGVISLRRF